MSPQCSATLLQVTYPALLFLLLSRHPHFALKFTSLPTSPQEHSFFTCLFCVWYNLLFTSGHVPQVLYLRSYPLPHAALEKYGKVLPHSSVSLSQPHLNIKVSLDKAIAEVPIGNHCLHTKGYSCARLACTQHLWSRKRIWSEIAGAQKSRRSQCRLQPS